MKSESDERPSQAAQEAAYSIVDEVGAALIEAGANHDAVEAVWARDMLHSIVLVIDAYMLPRDRADWPKPASEESSADEDDEHLQSVRARSALLEYV